MSSGSTTNMLRVSIESQKFPGSFLRMDGRDVTKYSDSGGGTVNVQNYVGTYETLIIVNYPDDNTFSIMSSAFPNVYLRMDGSDVKSGETYAQGAGKVNCQWGSYSWEKFRFENQEDGTKAIASVQFPNAYLRMENVTGQGGPSGAGTVNCQSYIGSYEKFKINVL
ncbi:hypothetical protein BDV27DRAFT_168441 [Aspergillus caelatus]|uniref:Uncharacterized protein n=2 Tax=Aspergillus subgen. Circumdati TaxID=2720871 RepID=A0A5N6ZPL5_9EURO|nr:uncharacterized protein BDV27DRAFT_168441 [Aspergillus caelatus]KAE8359564.1 hypothetical protein BDV27DRAFT_168441 [Aspergillus caelatus]KAE8415235.1 hypothetical protein BDV36DRAFT_285479 [Aspergillus pseudocaelatus]